MKHRLRLKDQPLVFASLAAKVDEMLGDSLKRKVLFS